MAKHFVVKCKACGFVLYAGDRPRPVKDIVAEWGGKCPRCASRLGEEPARIVVRARGKALRL
jgi:predicted Zn-ribbon and HTH transcriptional regulator